MKKAIVLVSFGTTHQDTREKTIDVLARDIESRFPTFDVFQSYTSSIVRKIVFRDEGIQFFHLNDLLDQLITDGYEKIYLQSSHIIGGFEYHKIQQAASKYRQLGHDIVVGNPLLSSYEDYQAVICWIKTQAEMLGEQESLVFMAHGTNHPAFTSYVALDYMLSETAVYMACVEGYPELELIMTRLKARNYQRIRLFPFMFVAGDHAKNDMASQKEGSWKTQLEANGFEVEAVVRGLGEVPEIRQLYVDHLAHLIDKDNEKDDR